MRAYTVATVAVTLGVTPKWLDNALSRFPIRGVLQSRQGVSQNLDLTQWLHYTSQTSSLTPLAFRLAWLSL